MRSHEDGDGGLPLRHGVFAGVFPNAFRVVGRGGLASSVPFLVWYEHRMGARSLTSVSFVMGAWE
ncbi:hypothetical protein VO63_22070 [Streptomyces showdoensis]|uniref:Uncharacterized protein n=1 Tax=Streptomyces showdoensis TaxID=68268 RepID=A0A2P2GJK9_STREW|nr:hypothetical protein VO63_22070 [Streptomyces showdoensis]